MTCEVKVFGKLTFNNFEDLESVKFEANDEDDCLDEISELISETILTDGLLLIFKVDASLTYDNNLIFQDWLEDAAEAAQSGWIDTWQEGYEDETYIRIHAGGNEEEIKGSMSK